MLSSIRKLSISNRIALAGLFITMLGVLFAYLQLNQEANSPAPTSNAKQQGTEIKTFGDSSPAVSNVSGNIKIEYEK